MLVEAAIGGEEGRVLMADSGIGFWGAKVENVAGRLARACGSSVCTFSMCSVGCGS